MKLLKQLMAIPKKSITAATPKKVRGAHSRLLTKKSITAATKKNTRVHGAHSRLLKNRSTYRALLLSSVRSTTRARLNGPSG